MQMRTNGETAAPEQFMPHKIIAAKKPRDHSNHSLHIITLNNNKIYNHKLVGSVFCRLRLSNIIFGEDKQHSNQQLTMPAEYTHTIPLSGSVKYSIKSLA